MMFTNEVDQYYKAIASLAHFAADGNGELIEYKTFVKRCVTS